MTNKYNKHFLIGAVLVVLVVLSVVNSSGMSLLSSLTGVWSFSRDTAANIANVSGGYYTDNIIKDKIGNGARLVGTPANDFIHGLDGDDILVAKGGKDIALGGDGDDVVLGGDGDDPKISGGKNDDLVLGGPGSDHVAGNIHNDIVYGGDGDDFVFGDAGDDIVLGGDGKDFIEMNHGNDIFAWGGLGNDIINANFLTKLTEGNKQKFSAVDGGVGNDLVNARGVIDYVNGGDGMDLVDVRFATGKTAQTTNIYGGAGSDIIILGSRNNSVYGDVGVTIPKIFKTIEELLVKIDRDNSDIKSINILKKLRDNIHANKVKITVDKILPQKKSPDVFVIGANTRFDYKGASYKDVIHDFDPDMDRLDIFNYKRYGVDYFLNQLRKLDPKDKDTVLKITDRKSNIKRTIILKDVSPSELSERNFELSDLAVVNKYNSFKDNSLNSSFKDTKIRKYTIGKGDSFGTSVYNDYVYNKGAVLNFEGKQYQLSHGNDIYIEAPGSKLSNNIGGGNGDDIFVTFDGDDEIHADDGEDIIFAGVGNDMVETNRGRDLVFGQDGNDNLNGGYGNDWLVGGSGNDFLNGGYGDDLLMGGSGSDHIWGGFGNDTIRADANMEAISVYEFNNWMKNSGNEMRDYVEYNGKDIIFKSPFRKLRNTTMRINALIKPGNDLVYAGYGDDIAYTGGGSDVVYAGQGNDIVYLFDGNDLAYGGDGNDKLYGGEGRDRLYGDTGDDYMAGGNSNDILLGGPGTDRIIGEAGNDILAGGLGNDTIFGGLGDDKIFGHKDNDYLFGNEGNDTLYGGDGNDILDGGEGNDVLNGYLGSNVYVFKDVFGKDTIRKFKAKGGDADLIKINKYGYKSFADIEDKIKQVGKDVHISLGPDSVIIILGLNKKLLTEKHFAFTR